MKISCGLVPGPEAADLAVAAEGLGYERVFVFDSAPLWEDTFVHLALIALIIGQSGVAFAAFIDIPNAVRPGAVRPGTSAANAIAQHYNVPPGTEIAQRARPGAIRPGEDEFRVNDSSFAGVVDLPDAARPGAIRPGEDRKLVPTPPPEEVFEVPPVVDRPLDIDDGEKIAVSSFVVVGAIDRPESFSSRERPRRSRTPRVGTTRS